MSNEKKKLRQKLLAAMKTFREDANEAAIEDASSLERAISSAESESRTLDKIPWEPLGSP